MTPEQCRQARERLGWTRLDLGLRANCSPETVKGFETGTRRLTPRSIGVIIATFEQSGLDVMTEQLSREPVAVHRSVMPHQCWQARQILGWSRSELAIRAGCSSVTIKNFEDGRHAGTVSTLSGITAALETAGVIFGDETGEGLGVRLGEGAL